jgi:hypothetical protein
MQQATFPGLHRLLAHAQAESNVLQHIEVREQGKRLKDGPTLR